MPKTTNTLSSRVPFDGNVTGIFHIFINFIIVYIDEQIAEVEGNGAIDWRLDGSFYGQPVVNGDTIYAGNGTNLVAISETAWKMTWQPLAIMLTAIAAMIGVVLIGGRTPE